MLAHLLTCFLFKADILIDQDGHARLVDFGLLTVSDTTTSSSPELPGTLRWISPERLDPDRFGLEDGRATKESDCYAFGMVIFEVLAGTGWLPSSYDRVVISIMAMIEQRPERPQGAEAVWFTDDLWGILEQCWSPEPKGRPTAETILEHLERGSTSWQPLPPTTDGDFQTDSDDDSQTDSDDDFGADSDNDSMQTVVMIPSDRQ